MCLALVAKAIDDEEYLKRLKIPQSFWPLISDSWERDEGSLYGRLDLSFDGTGTGEAARIQRRHADLDLRGRGVPMGLARAVDRAPHHSEGRRPVQFDPRAADRRLEEARRAGRHLHLTGTTDNSEDLGTLAYLEDTATQAGLSTTLIDIEDIGWRDARRLRRSRQSRHRVRLQALSLGMDVPRRLRRQACRGADALDRAAVEGRAVQQGHPAAAVGDVSRPSQSAAGLFRGRPALRANSAHPMCASRSIRARAPMSR